MTKKSETNADIEPLPLTQVEYDAFCKKNRLYAAVLPELLKLGDIIIIDENTSV